MKKRSTFKRKTNAPKQATLRNWSPHQAAREGARRKLTYGDTGGRLKGDCFPAANLGCNHPDFGMRPIEHALNKAMRRAEAAKQVRVPMIGGKRGRVVVEDRA